MLINEMLINIYKCASSDEVSRKVMKIVLRFWDWFEMCVMEFWILKIILKVFFNMFRRTVLPIYSQHFAGFSKKIWKNSDLSKIVNKWIKKDIL